MINSDLLVFLKSIRCNDLQFKLICFLSRHPRANFSFHTFLHALNTSTNNLKESIAALVDKGIVMARRYNNGLVTYSLAQQQNQEYIYELANLDQNSRRIVALLIVRK